MAKEPVLRAAVGVKWALVFNFAVSWPRENVAEIDFHQILQIRFVCENVAEMKNFISLAQDFLYGLP